MCIGTVAMLQLVQCKDVPPKGPDTVMILHHLPQTVKNNASKAEGPVRGIHSIVNLMRHHYTGSGSWVWALLIAAVAGMIAVAAVLVFWVRRQRGSQLVGSASVHLTMSWHASQLAPGPHWSFGRALPRPAFSELSATWPALPRPARRDRLFA